MICSTCGKDVDEYYKGRQCKPCIRIPQKASRERNREKERASKRKRYKENPEKFKRTLKISKSKRHVFYLIHQKLYDRYQTIKLTDVFIRKRLRQLVGPTHVITDQEIDERRQQIIRWRRRRKIRQIKKEYTPRKAMLICPLVKREIPCQTCDNMQTHYEKCQGCEYQTSQMRIENARKALQEEPS